MSEFKVAEIFGPTIQGEGSFAGASAHFIRFGGCDYHCSWCDSMHAVDPAKVRLLPSMTQSDIVEAVDKLGDAEIVVLSGGNPAVWDLGDVVKNLQYLGFKVHVETQGTIYKPWMSEVDHVTISPKPPSSDTRTPVRITQRFLNLLNAPEKHPTFDLKIVCFDVDDYSYMLGSANGTQVMDPYVTVGTYPDDTTQSLLARYREIITVSQEFAFSAQLVRPRIMPQMHVLLWGHSTGV